MTFSEGGPGEKVTNSDVNLMRMLRLFTRKATFSDDVLDLVLTNEDVRDESCGIEDGYTFSVFRAKTRDYVGYVSLRLGGVLGVGEGKQVLTAQTLYGNPLTRVDKLGGFLASMGLGFSWQRLDVGVNFGLAFGKFEKCYSSDGETFHQWLISRKAYPMVSLQASYSLRLWKKEPYNKVVKKN